MNNVTDEEVAQELKRIQELVSQSKIPPDVKPLDEQYEHIDL
jgi:flagellar biosynthesis regulator FlbT